MTEFTGAFWLAAGLGALAATAIFAASCLRIRSTIEFVLAAYVIGWSWLVTVLLGLSPARLVTRGWLLAGIALGFIGAFLAWRSCSRPRPPPFRSQPRARRPAVTIHPAVLVLAVVVLLGLGYSVALALFTPVNEGDSLAYHLARAAFWKQEQQIGYVPGAADLRLDVSPPNAEIGQLATMLLSGGDRYVVLPQLIAYGALLLCVAGLARRIGLDRSEALFAALVFATLPLVAVQASGALNDLVVASFLASAALFAMGSGHRSLVVFALAVGVALGTKLTAVLALPTLAVVVLAWRPRREWPAIGLASLIGLAVGSPWYVVNFLETSNFDGGLAEAADQRVQASAAAITVNTMRFGLDLIDMSGSPSPASGLYFVAALVLALVGAALWRRSWRSGVALVCAAALTTCTLLIPEVAELGRRSVFKAWIELGRPPTPPFYRGWGLNVVADPTDSWYGPLGAALLIAGVVVTAVLVSRGRLPSRAIVLSLAPWLLLVSLASAILWDPWRGRFLVFGVAVAASTWGVLLRSSVAAGAVTTIAVVAFSLSLVNYWGKPSGLGPRLDVESVYGISTRSIWGAERFRAQAWVRGNPSEESVLGYVEANVPRSATIAIAPRSNDYLFPYFGPRLTRRVALVPPAREVPVEAEWLVLAPRSSVRRCDVAWRRVLVLETGWSVERRIGYDSCLR